MKRLSLLTFISAVFMVNSALAASADKQTVIDSVMIEVQGTDDQNLFTFTEDVHVKNRDLDMTCNKLVVISMRGGDPKAAIGSIGEIKNIEATGDVVIKQGKRVAYAQKAEIDPATGTVVLSEQPRIEIDGKTIAEGWKIMFDNNNKGGRILSNLDGSKRATITLVSDSLPDLNYEKDSLSYENVNKDKANTQDTENTEPAPEGEAAPQE